MSPSESPDSCRNNLGQERIDWTEDALLPTISLINVSHPTIPNLYQRCFEYVERWQWSWETERVETGQWLFEPESNGP
jgi:hypothetical protein